MFQEKVKLPNTLIKQGLTHCTCLSLTLITPEIFHLLHKVTGVENLHHRRKE